MTRTKVALLVAFLISAAAIAGGIAYAQEASTLEAFELQEPDTDTFRSFSLFLDGSAFLGVYAEEISKENYARYGLREVRGVGITQIVKDSPAEKAGLRKDDVILRFDGESVTSVRKLNRLVAESSADQTVRLTISRGGSEQEVSVTLAKHRGATTILAPKIREDILKNFPKGDGNFVFAFGANRRIGISTQGLTKQLADYFGAHEGGVLITSVNENSPAAKAGLKAGDVITAINGEKVDSAGDISRVINKKDDGDVTLTVLRDRNTRTVTVTPEKHPERTIYRSGSVGGGHRIVIPSIEIPAVPEVNITVPSIVVPATPRIEVEVPAKAPRAQKARTVII